LSKRRTYTSELHKEAYHKIKDLEGKQVKGVWVAKSNRKDVGRAYPGAEAAGNAEQKDETLDKLLFSLNYDL
jgi:hypothetical protein